MKAKRNQETWVEDFKDHVLENTYWGSLAKVANLLVASALVRLILQKKVKRKNKLVRVFLSVL